MNIDDSIELFLQDRLVFCAEASVQSYRNNLHLFSLFSRQEAVYDTAAFDTVLVKRYVSYLRQRGVKNVSIHSYMRSFYAYNAWLIDSCIIPDYKYKVKLPKSDPSLVLPLSAAEVSHLDSCIEVYSSFPKRDYLMFHLMLDCGLRSSEVRHLKKCHINFSDNLVSIVNSKCNKSRLLPVPSALIQSLYNYSAAYMVNDYVFPISADGLKQLFSRIRHYSGVQRLHAHLLRHTFATSYMYYRRNIEYCRIYLGHSSYAVTQKYVHLASEMFLTNYDIYQIDDCFR